MAISHNPIRSKPVLKGYVALVLHAHLPYIRHHDRDDYMEERWFYEAMTETYLPLIGVFDRLIRDGIDFRVTMSMSPSLLSLCSDPLMQSRCSRHLDKLIELADKEQLRLKGQAPLLPLARMYAGRFRELKGLFDSCGGNIIHRFKQFQDAGYVEIVTCAATHGYLPLMKTEEAIRAQIATAVKDYVRFFGRRPRGIWLPECGYTVGVDRLLKQYGIDYFFADSTALEYASPRANRELYAPLMTPYGVSAFARDPESSSQVWSSEEGYPGDYDYREYYRDIGWDLGWGDAEEWEYIRPYVLPTRERVNTGIKYYRITGKGRHREPYNPERALDKAAEHAGNFLFNRVKQAEHSYAHLDRRPIIVCPYDAELFGHWWYEGPAWIEFLCRKMHHDQQTVRLITPSEYLAEYPIADTGFPNESSWGRHHSSEVWLQGRNDWIYRHLHQAEERMIRQADRFSRGGTEPDPVTRRALNQAARELMLAQSSDWAFIMDSGTVVDYAVRRTKDHLGCFNTLCGQIEDSRIQPDYLEKLEEKDNCFPDMDYRDYAPAFPPSPLVSIPDGRSFQELLRSTQERPNVFMLAWEYPPKQVGGLSRAVCELSEALAALGEIVHVVTTSHYGAPRFEMRNGVYVHRLPVLFSGDTNFFHWIFEMNLAMADFLTSWKDSGGRIDLLHAHDWMVLEAAREIKHSYGVPLAATIHATEWGRRRGRLEDGLPQRIHQMEWELTYEAGKVYVCSEYMKRQVQELFALREEKVEVHPNGIALPPEGSPVSGGYPSAARSDSGRGKTVFFIGRLVYEKGVHVLLEAAPLVLSKVPDARFIIAGSGPMEEELRRQAAHLGDKVWFAGFVDDDARDRLYEEADVCVFPSLYEPFGIVALEAMGYRKPLVVSDTGGMAELVRHGTDGYKALPGHAESLAWHITELLLNPELGRRMAEQAWSKLIGGYRWPGIAAGMQSSYRELIAGNEPAFAEG